MIEWNSGWKIKRYCVGVFREGKYIDSIYTNRLYPVLDRWSKNDEYEILVHDIIEYNELTNSDVNKVMIDEIKEMLESMPMEELVEQIERLEQREQKPTTIRQQWACPVLCVETGKAYASIRECSDDMGIPYMTILNCARRGNANRGYHFKFKEVKKTNN